MPDEVTFFDLVTLMKIKPGITVERYGGLINSSFFDGAKVLGTLQQKKLISLTTAMPDQNPITVTDTGKQLIAEADNRATQEFDHLDLEILIQVSKGKSNPDDLGRGVNVRPKDLAMHLYRLTKQDYATYELVSGTVNIMLTEKGFSQSKTGMPVKPQPQAPQQATVTGGPGATVPQPPEMMTMQQQMGGAQAPMGSSSMGPAAQAAPEEAKPEQPMEHHGHTKRNAIILLVVVIILVVVGYLYYTHTIAL
jgi:hypothetical protein